MSQSIEIRQLDKRYTYAKYRAGCSMADCHNQASFWLTRTDQHYCRSDLVCVRHARLWLMVKKIIDSGVSL